MATCTIAPYSPPHWPAVKRIYADGIATGNATFETSPPAESAWAAKFIDGLCHVALDADGSVCGWAGAVAVSDRCAYNGVAEVSVYVCPQAQGQGVGRALLGDLVSRSEHAGIWTLQAGIFPENTGSIRLHTACGFRLMGYRERIGQLDGKWRDVNQYERRSDAVGISHTN